MTLKTLLAIAAVTLGVAPAASAATIAYEGDALVVRGGSANESIYLDDSYNPPDPAQALRFDGDAVFTSVPPACAQREDTMVDCPVPARVRVELGAGNDRFGILNELSVALAELVVDGGEGSDSLTGDHVVARSETLLGGPGDDRLDGMGGDDVLHGGPGSDVLNGNAGNDVVLGEDGDDELSGDGQAAPGADVVDGGAGTDKLDDYRQYGVSLWPNAGVSLDGAADDGRAGEGDNVTAIERYVGYVAGAHVLTDGAEDWQVWSNLSPAGSVSVVRAMGGDDRIVGQDASEDIDGGAGNDYLEGGKGHDTLTGGPGRDVIFGDETDTSCNSSFPESCVRYGNDVIQARDGEVDQITCGPGTDRAVVDAIDVVAPDCETVERGGAVQDGTAAPGGGTPTVQRRLALVGKPRLKAALRSGLKVRITGGAPGKAEFKALQGRRTVAGTRATVRKDGTATIRLRFTKAAAKRLRSARKVTLTITGPGTRTTVILRR
jgi:hypothetical protein